MPLPTDLREECFRALTSTRDILTDMTIQPETLRKHCPIDNDRLQRRVDITTKGAPSASQSIGSLKMLPIEIMDSILSIVDLQSLTKFRAVSWSARALVDNLQPYSAVFRHSPDALRAIISTQMAAHFTAQDVFEALCKNACFNCGHFGPLLDLFTCQRSCLPCVLRSDSLLSITASSARKDFQLSSRSMRTLPSLLSLPGTYTESVRTYRKRVFLVRAHSAATARTLQFENTDRRASSGMLAAHLPTLPVSQIQQPVRFDGRGDNPHRFMSMIRFPAYDRTSGRVEWGVFCQACSQGPRDQSRGYRDWNILFSVRGYLDHYQQCEVSKQGKDVVDEELLAGGDHQRIHARLIGFYTHLKYAKD